MFHDQELINDVFYEGTTNRLSIESLKNVDCKQKMSNV